MAGTLATSTRLLPLPVITQPKILTGADLITVISSLPETNTGATLPAVNEMPEISGLAESTVRPETIRTVRESGPLLENPLKDIFHLDGPIDVKRLKLELQPIAEEHGIFFKRLTNILNMDDDQSLNEMHRLENATLDQNNRTKLTLQKLNALINNYRYYYPMEEVVRFYERLEKLEIKTTDSMKATYVLALNRTGNFQKATEVSLPFVEENLGVLDRSDHRVMLQTEFITAIGTARKNEYLKSGNQGALEEANKLYVEAFKRSLTYYPGVNVVRTFLYKGDIEKAKQYARLVSETVLHADIQKSFWPIATQLEMAIVLEDKTGVDKALSNLKNLIPNSGKTDLESLITHLKLVKDKNLLPGVTININDIINKLETPSLIQEGPGNLLEKFESRTSYTVGRGRWTQVTPFNARWGGIVVDTQTGPIDAEMRFKILEKLIGSKKEIIEMDLETFMKKLHGFVEDAFRIRNEAGVRDIENMTEERHIELEAFWIGLKDLVSYNDSEMAATSISLLSQFIGDCRHTNETFQYFGNGKLRLEREELLDQAIKHLADSRIDQFNETLDYLRENNRCKFSLMDARIYSREIGSTGPYEILRESPDGETGRAVLADPVNNEDKHIDSHTFTILTRYDKDRVPYEQELTCSWYSNEDLFQMRGVIIGKAELEEFARTGELKLPEGAKVVNLKTGEEKFVGIKIVPETFSNPRQKYARRQDLENPVVGSFVVTPPQIDSYLDVTQREKLYKNFIEPVIIHGLEIMAANSKKPVDQERAAKYLTKLRKAS